MCLLKSHLEAAEEREAELLEARPCQGGPNPPPPSRGGQGRQGEEKGQVGDRGGPKEPLKTLTGDRGLACSPWRRSIFSPPVGTPFLAGPGCLVRQRKSERLSHTPQGG
jgi:hypothetical protein